MAEVTQQKSNAQSEESGGKDRMSFDVHTRSDRAPFDVHTRSCRSNRSNRSQMSGMARSFLNPTGAHGDDGGAVVVGPTTELVIFFGYVMIRAFHPVLIADSKTQFSQATGEKSFPYESGSVTLVMAVSTCIFFIVFCRLQGQEIFESIFEREPLLIFSMNGAVYALGDFLEMNSLSGISASTYSIIMQYRIVVTALVLMPAKHVYQTRFQWLILLMVVFGSSTYIGHDSDGSGSRGSGSGVVLGVVFALLKVIVSCVGAVLTDKGMKKNRDDAIHVNIARMFIAWSITLLILSFAPRAFQLMNGQEVKDIYSGGLFNGWDGMTIAVTISFVIKSVSTLYVVGVLDAILKNIAEAFAVLVVYGYDIAAPWVHKRFDPASFMAVLVVVAACLAYIESKVSVAKADEWDIIEAEEAEYQAEYGGSK